MSERTDKLESTSVHKSFLLEAIRALVATLIATGAASWTARGILSDYDRRLTVLETQEANIERQIATDLVDIKLDVRELRSDLTTRDRSKQ